MHMQAVNTTERVLWQTVTTHCQTLKRYFIKVCTVRADNVDIQRKTTIFLGSYNLLKMSTDMELL